MLNDSVFLAFLSSLGNVDNVDLKNTFFLEEKQSTKKNYVSSGDSPRMKNVVFCC